MPVATTQRAAAHLVGARLQACRHSLDPSGALAPEVEEDANLDSRSTSYSNTVIPTEGPPLSADRSGGIKARSQHKQHRYALTTISQSHERAGSHPIRYQISGIGYLVTKTHGTPPTPLLLCRSRNRQLQPRRRTLSRLPTFPLPTNPQARRRTRRPSLRPSRSLRPPHQSRKSLSTARSRCPSRTRSRQR